MASDYYIMYLALQMFSYVNNMLFLRKFHSIPPLTSRRQRVGLP